MGMAASQARLLSLTSRLHDVEFQAQSIMSQKLALATQKDALYEDYCAALDATTIQVAFRNGAEEVYVDATYDTVCNYQEGRYKQYALRDNQSGLMIVSPEVAEIYGNPPYGYGGDKYVFAYAMMGFDNSFGWGANSDNACEIGIGQAMDETDILSESGSGYSMYMTECEQMVYDMYASSDSELAEKYDDIFNAEGDLAKKDALDVFRAFLYDNYANEIFDYMNLDKQESKEYATPYDDRSWSDVSAEFNYYLNLWEAINAAGGCTSMDETCTSGDKGKQWFNNMVNSGLATIMVLDESAGKKSWSDTSVATSINGNYLQEVQDDKDLKKAEAEYEHALDIINRKDTKFDNDLSKLETERTSITTEMDSIKTVRDDNVKRTFGIFS